MELKPMYPGLVNSRGTVLLSEVDAGDAIIYISNESCAPQPPNLMVLGGSLSNAETVRIVQKDGNVLGVERGFQGTARAWPAGTPIARNFTEYDYAALIENIRLLVEGMEAIRQELSEDLQRRLDALEQRLAFLEDTLYTDFTTNPYAVRFDSLEGLEVQGVWNQELQCLEC